MRSPYGGTPSPSWRQFLTQNSDEIWACDLFTVQTGWFQTLYVFFVIHHGPRELLHERGTTHPHSQWLAQQTVEACGLSSEPTRYLIHDRDGCLGAAFNRRVASPGIRQLRTPVKAPKANALAERWMRTIRDEFVAYYNRWRPHRSLGQIARCSHVKELPTTAARHLVAKPVLGGLLMCANGQLDNTDGVFAPYKGPEVHKIAGSDFGPQSDP